VEHLVVRRPVDPHGGGRVDVGRLDRDDLAGPHPVIRWTWIIARTNGSTNGSTASTWSSSTGSTGLWWE
jgi:hypothetical protein